MDSVGCLRLRGLPYQTTQGQIMDFFSPDYTVIDVLITRSEGAPGLRSVSAGLVDMMDSLQQGCRNRAAPDACRHACSTSDCVHVPPDPARPMLPAGKPNGQAFVLLPKAEAAKAQAELNNRYLGKRFIE